MALLLLGVHVSLGTLRIWSIQLKGTKVSVRLRMMAPNVERP